LFYELRDVVVTRSRFPGVRYFTHNRVGTSGLCPRQGMAYEYGAI
jgi:hypothetical protein